MTTPETPWVPLLESGPDLAPIILATSIVSIVLCTTGVSIRLFTKLHYGSRMLELEDWLIAIPGYLPAMGIAIAMAVATRYGLGKHIDELTFEQLTEQLATLFAVQLPLNFSLAAIRISLLLFIRRLAVAVRWIHFTCGVLIVFTCVFLTTTIFLSIFQCMPIESAWNPARIQSEDCLPSEVFYSCVIIGLTVDISIFILPAILINMLPISRKKKIQSIIMFFLGGCGCIAECLRFQQIYTARTSQDASYILARIILSCFLQVAFGLLCCCIPAVKMLALALGGPTIRSCKAYISTNRSGQAKDSQETPHSNHPQVEIEISNLRGQDDNASDLENGPGTPGSDFSARSPSAMGGRVVHPADILAMNHGGASHVTTTTSRTSDTMALERIMDLTSILAFGVEKDRERSRSTNTKESGKTRDNRDKDSDEDNVLPIFCEDERGRSRVIKPNSRGRA